MQDDSRLQKNGEEAYKTESCKEGRGNPGHQKAKAHQDSIPRLLIAAAASGSGKTVLTCGLLELLGRRGMSLVSFKCGPDYIDPAFHSHVLGIRGYNLDSFFLEERAVKAFFQQKAEGADLAVIEGVMGYYDGVAGTSTRASTYDIARITDTPVILVVDGKKCSLSMAALVKGFLEYREDSRIMGVILNRTSPVMEQRLRPFLEELGVVCLGAVPECDEARLESRHLGLALPREQVQLKDQMAGLADRLEKCLDVDRLLALAGAGRPAAKRKPGKAGSKALGKEQPCRRIAVAMDEAFCFYYQENLDFLKEHGWELVPFSPVHDQCLPEHVDALLLGGGYPECYAGELSGNREMLQAVGEAAARGVKILAECGGFLYLHESLEGIDGTRYPMAGLVPADGFRTEGLSRFGYVILEERRYGEAVLSGEKASFREEPSHGEPFSSGGRTPAGEVIRGHEFHYWDSTRPGASMIAKKPSGTRQWPCMYVTGQMLAGFPHLYYPSGPSWILDFLEGKREGAAK